MNWILIGGVNCVFNLIKVIGSFAPVYWTRPCNSIILRAKSKCTYMRSLFYYMQILNDVFKIAKLAAFNKRLLGKPYQHIAAYCKLYILKSSNRCCFIGSLRIRCKSETLHLKRGTYCILNMNSVGAFWPLCNSEFLLKILLAALLC